MDTAIDGLDTVVSHRCVWVNAEVPIPEESCEIEGKVEEHR